MKTGRLYDARPWQAGQAEAGAGLYVSTDLTEFGRVARFPNHPITFAYIHIFAAVVQSRLFIRAGRPMSNSN